MYIVQIASGSLRDGSQQWLDLAPVYKTLTEAKARLKDHRASQVERPDPIRVVVIVK
jgi:hypothetical protein